MKQRKLVILIAAVFSVCAMANFALAQNRVELKVTSEPIAYGSECSKAGSFSLQFDAKTEINAGDQITIDLPYNSEAEKVVICNKDIDFIVAPTAITSVVRNNKNGIWTLNGAGWSTAYPVPEGTAVADNALLFSGLAPNITGELVFYVHGALGSNRITIDVIGSSKSKITVPAEDPTSTVENLLILKIFDLGITGIHTATYDEDTDTYTYNKVAPVVEKDDNALCISVFKPGEVARIPGMSVFKASMDSVGIVSGVAGLDKFTFIPSDPQIAHLSSGSSITVFDCKNAKTGAIRLPSEQGDCSNFDFEYGSGYHEGHSGNRVVFQSTTDFKDEEYKVKLEIVSPSYVYWSNEEVTYRTSKEATCSFVTGGYIYGDQASYEYRDAAGDKLGTGNIEASATSCTLDTKARAKIITTNSISPFTGVEAKGIYIDMPSLIYTSEATLGDEVKVKVSLIKTPCGETSKVFSLGFFGTAKDNALTIFPYFTAMSASDWWNGFALNNMSAVDGTAKLFVYESDGDQATISIPVKSHQTYVALLSSMVDSMTMTKSVDGTLGNSTCYIWVCSDFLADGFAMIASQSNDANGSESMGYLPRGGSQLIPTNDAGNINTTGSGWSSDWRRFCESN